MKKLVTVIFLFSLMVSVHYSYADEELQITEISNPAKLSELIENAPRCPPLYFSYVDVQLRGLPYIYVPRTDSNQPGLPFSFHVNKSVIIYLLVHPRGDYAPKGWKKTTLTTKWIAGQYTVSDVVYAKKFQAGKIEIPSHPGMRNHNTQPPYGLGHCAVIASATETDLSEMPLVPEIKITSLSNGAMLSDSPIRTVISGIGTIVPDRFKNSQFIYMPRGDSNSPGQSYSFNMDKESDVYIMVQSRGTPTLPDWKKTDYSAIWYHSGNTHLDHIYKKHFNAGVVTIPENNGNADKIFGIPHMAIVPNAMASDQTVVSWDLQNLGLKNSIEKKSFNDKPLSQVDSVEKIKLITPVEEIEPGKIYSLNIWARNETPSVFEITAQPKLSQPFGKDFLVTSKWSKIVCPIVFTADSLKSELVFNVTIPANTILEPPVLCKDNTGILPNDNQIVKYLPIGDWKPVNMGIPEGRFQPIKKGTALDFSNIPVRIPAGEKGRIVVNPQGNLAFEQDIDTPVRFRSCTFPFDANISIETIDNFVDNLMVQGYNMVRFHGPKFRKAKYMRYGVTIEDVTFIPQSNDDFDEFFDEEKLRKFDYVLSELGKRGIYVYFDVMTSFAGWTDALQPGHWVGKDLLGRQFHAQLYVNAKFRQNWKAGITYLLNRTNTVNGKLWKDDPAFACMLFMNEQDFRVTPSYLSAFEPQWEAYYGADAPTLSEQLLKSDSSDGRKAGKFILEKIADMNQFYINTIRAAGYKGLVTNWDLYMRMIDVPGWACMDVSSMHSYHGHPGMPKNINSVPGYPVKTDYGEKEISINTQSSIADNGKYLARILCKRNINTPSMIMEYGDTAPNPFRHEAGLFFASYAAMNGIDALQPHGAIIANKPFAPLTPYLYSDFRDPIFRASDIINVFGFLRGDIVTAKHNVEFIITPDILESANRLDALSLEYTKTFLLTKVGMRYSRNPVLDYSGNVKADLEVVPRYFAKAQGTSVEAVTTIETSLVPEISRNIVCDLRKYGVLAEDNKTDSDKNFYESETSQLVFQPSLGTMQVNTPRLEGVVIKENLPVKINRFSVENCSTPAAITVVSLQKDKILENSDHLLLVISTNSVNTGMVTNAEGNRILDIGDSPLLMRTGVFSLKLRNKKTITPVIYALNLDGTHADKVSVQQAENGMSLKIDTSTLSYCTPFFEIIY